MRHFILVWCVVLLSQGCSVVKPYPDAWLPADERMCRGWLANIEAALEANDLLDPATVPIDGFPQLSVNRFLVSMTDKAAASDDAFADWLEEMRKLDAADKAVGFANLPGSVRRGLVSQSPMSGSFSQALQDCGRRLNQFGLNNPDLKENLFARLQVPEAYQNWKRVIGLYPLASFVASFSLERLHRELAASFKIPLSQLPSQGVPVIYSPPRNNPLSSENIAGILRLAYDNPLGIPRLQPDQLRQFLAHFAPLWEIDTRNETDSIGTIFQEHGGQPQVDVNRPAVYAGQAYARWQGKVVLQLIYQIWLPAREKIGPLDLYGGLLDSVIWRVTLGPDGEPIGYDSIHGCGCYYLLFPAEKYRPIPPQDGAEPVLSPKAIENIPPGGRLLLRLQSRTHYLQQVALSDDAFRGETRQYDIHDLDELFSLQGSNGVRQSLYGSDGVIEASARTERFLLWPYGVASPGAMRQWGVHAIAFVGKRYFDDPYLLEYLMEEK